MRKNFILDTNVLLYDPNAINIFANSTVIIPLEVIEQLDTFKRETSQSSATMPGRSSSNSICTGRMPSSARASASTTAACCASLPANARTCWPIPG